MAEQPDLVSRFHPRGTLLSSAFGRSFGRASVVGAVVAVLGASLATIPLRDQPWAVAILVPALGAAAVGTVAAMAVVPPRTRRAYETFAWLGSREARRFRERTASRVPVKPEVAARWLADNPRSPATALFRVEVLAMLGRTPEAETELALLAPPRDDREAVEQALNRSFVRFVATGQPESEDLEALAGRLPAGSEAALELAAGTAIGEARARLESGRQDWREPMLAVRPALGFEATLTTLRDLWRPLGTMLLVFTLIVALVSAVGQGVRPV